MITRGHFVQFTTFAIIFVFLFLLAACGGSGDTAATSSSSNTDNTQTTASAAANAVATMPAPQGNFAAVSEQNVLTDTANLTNTQSTTATAGTVNLAVGVRAYEKNKCADCHGAKGEGVADKGKAITGTALSLAEFDKLLRTGGGLGNTHIFGRSAVSPTGMEALYAYVQSLK